MPDAVRIIRIFISSPGDVLEERDQASRVIDGLQRQFPQSELRTIRWEELALPATASFQESIDHLLRKEPIDIAVFILWSRLGNPLGPRVTRADGTPYRSGTEREFDLMLAAFEQSGRQRPLILAYTRDDTENFKRKLMETPAQEVEGLLEQRKLAEAFIREHFQDAEGRNVRAYHSYPESVTFALRLHIHLRSTLGQLLGSETSIRWNEEPYRGLEAFDMEHAAIFQGRDEETVEILQRLRDQETAGCAFVVIVGASGSGKSSLAQAGVAATLVHHAYDAGVRAWRVVLFVPSLWNQNADLAPTNDAPRVDPLLRHLIAELNHLVPELTDAGVTLDDITTELANNPATTVRLTINPAFVRASQQAGGSVRVLLLLDQLEELWTVSRITPSARERFWAAVEALARSGHVAVLATLRSDFYPQAQRDAAFLRMKGDRGHCDLLPPSLAALQRMITEPAHLAGLQFERRGESARSLDETILQAAANDPSALPLLQYALLELYAKRDRESRLLTFAAYSEIGGVEGAIGTRAGTLFESLPSEAQMELGEILTRLVTIDVVGDLAAVRRRALLDELTATPARKLLTDKLIEARFLTTDRQGDARVAGFTHEALLRHWPAVAHWIAENREFLRLRVRVEQLQKQWQSAERPDDLLLPAGLLLEEGKQLLQQGPQFLSDELRHYIRESIAYHKRRAERNRRIRGSVIAALSTLTVIALIGGAFAWAMKLEADVQRGLAVGETEKTKKLAEANRTLANDNAAKARLAEEQKELAQAQTQKVEESSREVQQSNAALSASILTLRSAAYSAQVKQASLLAESQSAKALAILYDERLCPSEFRDFTWGFLNRVCQRNLAILGGHSAQVNCASFSPDGRTLASGSADNTVKLWNVASGELQATLGGHDASVNSISFTPDGRTLASGSADNTIKLWNVARGQEQTTLAGHGDGVNCVSFSPDGRTLASASADKKIKLWDVVCGKERATLTGHRDSVSCISFSLDGHTLASGSEDRGIKLWDVASGQEQAKLMSHSDRINSLSFSPDGRTLASASADETIGLWDVASGEERARLTGHNGAVYSVSFSPDGSVLASGSNDYDHTIKLWDVASGQERATLAGHGDGVTCVSFSPDGRTLASASADKTIRLWDAASGQERATLAGHGGSVSCVSFSPDGRTLASASADKTIRLWDVASGQERARLAGHNGAVYSVSFSPDGRTLASGSHSGVILRLGEIKLWDVASGQERATLAGHDGVVTAVSFSSDGRTVASASTDRMIKLWDVATAQELITLHGHIGSVDEVSFSPDGRTLASGSEDRTIKLWDVASSEERATLAGHSGSVSSVSFSSDGGILASGDSRGAIKLWDVASGQERATLPGHTERVSSVSFAPDGRTLASAGFDKMIRLWDVASGQERATLAGHNEGITELSFSPDGRTLASGSWDNKIKLWDVVSGRERATCAAHIWSVRCLSFSPDGRTLASGSDDFNLSGEVKLWDLASGQERATLSGHQEEVKSMTFSTDGRTLASASADKTIKLWDVASGRERATLFGHSDAVTSVSYSPDGRTLASGSTDNTIKLWDVASGHERATLAGHSSSVNSVSFSPDGRTVASGSTDNTIKLWDVASGHERATLAGHCSSVNSVSFSPDGRTVASGNTDNTIKLWDVASGHERATLAGHSLSVNSVSFSPDGRTLASGSDDRTIKLWDIEAVMVEESRRRSARLVSYGADLIAAEQGFNWFKICANLHPLIAGFPENADFRMRRGRAYAELGWWPEAVEDFQAVSRLKPDHPTIEQGLGTALAALEEMSESDRQAPVSALDAIRNGEK